MSIKHILSLIGKDKALHYYILKY